jgi:hypothetical protein
VSTSGLDSSGYQSRIWTCSCSCWTCSTWTVCSSCSAGAGDVIAKWSTVKVASSGPASLWRV